MSVAVRVLSGKCLLNSTTSNPFSLACMAFITWCRCPTGQNGAFVGALEISRLRLRLWLRYTYKPYTPVWPMFLSQHPVKFHIQTCSCSTDASLTIHVARVGNFGWSKTAHSITDEAFSLADVNCGFVSRCEIQYRTREWPAAVTFLPHIRALM